ncbi:MAG: TolC family protein, partial [Paludibacteraceae bacterium]|nr:TolC family protein [Paludibacteraceae bacterium]
GNRLAQVGVEAAQLQQQMTERDQLESVEQTFWLIVGLQDKQQTLTTTLQLLDTIHHLVTTSVQACIALQSDLLQVEMRQSELNRMQVQLANGITLASQALCQAIGINYSDSFHVVNDTLLLTDTSTTYNLLPTTYYLQPTTSLPPLPENRLLALQTRANELQYRMTLADALPQVAVAATYGYGKLQADIVNDLEHDKGNGAVMLTVSVPLSAWWETGHKLKAQRLAIQRAQLEQEDKSELLALRTQQNYQQWTEAQWMVQAAQTALQQAQENYRLVYLNYQSGMNTITDLLTAQSLLDKAHNDYTDALIHRRLAYRHLFSLFAT